MSTMGHIDHLVEPSHHKWISWSFSMLCIHQLLWCFKRLTFNVWDATVVSSWWGSIWSNAANSAHMILSVMDNLLCVIHDITLVDTPFVSACILGDFRARMASPYMRARLTMVSNDHTFGMGSRKCSWCHCSSCTARASYPRMLLGSLGRTEVLISACKRDSWIYIGIHFFNISS